MKESEKFNIELKVNDQPVPLNPFATEVVRNVVFSLVSSLKLESEIETIELKLTKEE